MPPGRLPSSPSTGSALTLGLVLATWWPLAASWLLMGIEMPLVTAVMGRLPDETVQLAAYGGVFFPISLAIEAPVIMLLAASTRLCDSPENYRYLQRFSRRLGLALTGVHGLIAFTPLFDLVVVPLLDTPEAVVEPARLGFQFMLPFTIAVAERRFHQGVLIRYGRQRKVGVGTIIRLVAVVIPLMIGLAIGTEHSAAVAGFAISSGVVAEAIYARWCVLEVERGPMREAVSERSLDLGTTISFYFPLALTSVLSLASYPICSAGMNRMPDALTSLAIWSAVTGLGFFSRSSGMAFNEVVIRHAGDAEGARVLTRFMLIFGLGISALVALVAATPLGEVWYVDLERIPEDGMSMARLATWLMVPMPFLTFLISYWQGMLVHAHQTRPISEGVGIGLTTIGLVLVIFVSLGTVPGGVAATLAITLAGVLQAAWLAIRWNGVRRRGIVAAA
ncbi:MAG: hypothetical protein P8J88_13960 [Phycisphaerales bacterium]|nr:hypothetical protein [Phycisphaerales bacterium]MDG2134582.1 hypothetical protein [Phycisphaerales bacterium]